MFPNTFSYWINPETYRTEMLSGSIEEMEKEGVRRGFYSYDFLEPLRKLAERFQGDSDRFTMLWMVYEEGYYEGQLLREKVSG